MTKKTFLDKGLKIQIIKDRFLVSNILLLEFIDFIIEMNNLMGIIYFPVSLFHILDKKEW